MLKVVEQIQRDSELGLTNILTATESDNHSAGRKCHFSQRTGRAVLVAVHRRSSEIGALRTNRRDKRTHAEREHIHEIRSRLRRGLGIVRLHGSPRQRGAVLARRGS